MFNWIGNNFKEERERQICEEIMEKAHKSLTEKQLLVSGEKVCVWDLLRRSGHFDDFASAVQDLGGGAFEGDEPPLPDPLKRSTIKSIVNFLLNVIPKPSIAEELVRMHVFDRQFLTSSNAYNTHSIWKAQRKLVWRPHSFLVSRCFMKL